MKPHVREHYKYVVVRVSSKNRGLGFMGKVTVLGQVVCKPDYRLLVELNNPGIRLRRHRNV